MDEKQMKDYSEKQDNSPIDHLSYELAYNELEEIVATLEQDNLSLEAALALYARGQLLSQHCTKLLDQAELKVQKLSDGELVDFSAE
jgi:exodeoxyribonuclease VII small subunit